MSKLANPENISSKVLISADRIRERINELAQQIDNDYVDREIDIVCLANSAMTFAADLVRQIHVSVRQHNLAFVSYSQAPQSGEVRITLDIAEPLQGRHVLMVEGMVISGRTPFYLTNLLRLRQPASLELCAIGIKPAELAVDLPIKYRLFEFGKEWVAGYGIGHGVEKASPDLLDMASA